MGKVPLFSERAPFKLSADFWEVIGGWRSFKRFCEMFEAAYAVAAAAPGVGGAHRQDV